MLFAPPEGTDTIAVLASGSTFVVALIRDRGDVLVCKRLLPRLRAEPAARAAMVREAMLLSRAAHPSLPELRRVGMDAHGPFVVETHVEGKSLRSVVEGWQRRGKPVPARLVAHIAAASSEALAELHGLADARGALRLSHGDLGPDHVFLGPLGEVRFVDLGAARFAGMEPALSTDDRGTLPFAAPEVARGEAPPGQAADVYALAATLLFLSTGGPLSRAQGDAAMLLEVGERGLDAALCARAEGFAQAGREALARALALDPSKRLATARALWAALATSSWW